METKRQVELAELVSELQKENLQKRDFVIPAKCISMRDGKIVITNYANSDALRKILQECSIGHSPEVGGETIINQMELVCLDVIHNHLSDKLNIPKRYYDRMLGKDNELLDFNVSYWLKKSDNKTNYLLRCFVDKEEQKGYARALLSDRFKVIDNIDILLAVLAAIKESGLDIQIDTKGCDLTEKRMYLRFICPSIEINAPELLKAYKPNGADNSVGNGIISGFVISNSEVGLGQMSISPRAKIKVCSNGLIISDENFAKTHLGGKMEQFATIEWSEETKQKNLELIIAQVKDAIKTYVSEDYLGKKISEIIAKGKKELEYPLDAVKAVTNSS